MDAVYFISHSSVDGYKLACQLRDNFVRAGTKAWLAPDDIPASAPRWDDEIDEALQNCKAVFFLITADSVHHKSGTRQELDRAKRYKKPIVPLRFDQDAVIPYSLEGRQEIHFVDRFEGGLAELREHCRWLASREGEIYQLESRIEDAKRELPREHNQLRKQQIEKDLANLQESLAATRQAFTDTAEAGRNLRSKIDEGIKRERLEPEPERHDRIIPVVNRRPASAANNFQNRTAETQLMGQFLEDPSKRLLLVVGRGGVGKTAMVCRMLQEIENGRFPGDHVLRIKAGGIVYMGAGPARNISFTNLYDDLCRLLPEGRRASLERLWAESKELTPRLVALTSAFSGDPVIVLLDNFEDFIDSSTQNISDQELGEVLQNLLALPDHSIKVIITSQVTPRALALYQPGRQMSLPLHVGLPSPYAKKLLQLMDSDGSVGLRDASPDVLDEICSRTQGIPRALEAFYGILAADRYTRVSDILADANILPDNVVQELVARAYHRLDKPAQRVFQALAAYGEPVIAEAVDFLLEPFGPPQPSELILRRLVGMFLVRREGRHFFLHPVDAAFALTEIPEGVTEDWASGNAIFTRKWLFHRGGAYFRKIRRPEAGWRSIADLGPVLAEFKLLAGAGDWDGAYDTLETMLPFLDRWGHARQIERLAARLACEAGQPIRSWAAGLAGGALSDLGESPAAIDYLELALEASPQQISASALLNWRRTLGDCHFSLGHYPAAEAAYKQVLELEVEESTHKAMALLGLGSIAVVQSRPLEAEQQYRHALALYAPQLSVAIVEEGDKTILAPSTLPADLALENPFSWRWLTDPFSIVDSDSGQAQGRLWLYGVEIPGKNSDATPPANSVGDAADNDIEDIEVALIQPTSQLAEIWMSFAELYAGTGRLREADAACRLSEKMYGDVQNDLGVSRALDLMRRLAAQLSEEDADQIAKAQEERLQRARDARDRSLEIAILKDLAECYLERSRYRDAEATYQELSRLGTELENPSLLASAEFGLAWLDWVYREKPDDAIRRLEGLRENRSQDLRLQSDVDLLLARIEFSRKRRDTAARHSHKAAAGYAFLGSLSKQIEADRLLASIAIDARDYDRAVRRLQGTVELARAVGIPSLITSVLCDLAKAHLSAGQREASIARIEEAAGNATDIELPYTQAEALMTIGYIRSELKNFALAEDAYQQAREVYERLGDRYGQFQTLSGLSWLYYLAGEPSKRLKVAGAAWELIQEFGDRSVERDARMDLSMALSANGFYGEAIEHMKAIVNEAPTAANIGNLGWILYEAGEYARSLEESRRALEIDPSEVWVIRNLAHAYLALGKADDAKREYKRAIQIRKGGENFFETIRIVRKLAVERPDLPRVHEMLQMLEQEQQAIEAKGAAVLAQG